MQRENNTFEKIILDVDENKFSYLRIFLISIFILSLTYLIFPKNYEAIFFGKFTKNESQNSLLNIVSEVSSKSYDEDIEIIKSDTFLKFFVTDNLVMIERNFNRKNFNDEEKLFYLVNKLKKNISLEIVGENLVRIRLQLSNRDDSVILLTRLVKKFNTYKKDMLISEFEYKIEKTSQGILDNDIQRIDEILTNYLYSLYNEMLTLDSYPEPVITTIDEPSIYSTKRVPTLSQYAFLALLSSMLITVSYYFRNKI
jgi:hypothetical protein